MSGTKQFDDNFFQNDQSVKTDDEILELAKKTINIEAQALINLQKNIDKTFAECVRLISQSPGRVVVTGIGKSAIIAQKIVATLNSTGTPAIYMHAADAIHGDLGIIQQADHVICISKSGNTPEIKILVPLLKRGGNKLIAIVGNLSSYLAVQADYVLNAVVEKEACPNNLAPTSSTTAQLVIGDALAVCLISHRGFTAKDFAHYHPGGALGKKLYLKVGDISVHNARPAVGPDTGVKDVILEISKNRLGAAAVIQQNLIIGVITDGDLRRMLEKNSDIAGLKASDIMSPQPKQIEKEDLAIKALAAMQEHSVSQLIVADKGVFSGFIHIHDLMREGII